MPEQKCPHCGKHVIVNAAGICTNCREPVRGPKQTINPYQHPSAESPLAKKVARQRSFAYQASRFALIAPFVAILLTQLGNALSSDEPQGSTGMYVLLVTAWLLIALGFVFGIAGIIGSFRRRDWGTVAMGVVGAILCGGLIGAIVLTLIR